VSWRPACGRRPERVVRLSHQPLLPRAALHLLGRLNIGVGRNDRRAFSAAPTPSGGIRGHRTGLGSEILDTTPPAASTTRHLVVAAERRTGRRMSLRPPGHTRCPSGGPKPAHLLLQVQFEPVGQDRRPQKFHQHGREPPRRSARRGGGTSSPGVSTRRRSSTRRRPATSSRSGPAFPLWLSRPRRRRGEPGQHG
jgi:hypothetical protein